MAEPTASLPHFQTLGHDEWLAAIQSPTVEPEFFLANCTRLQPGWNNSDRILPEHLLYLPLEGSCHGVLDGDPVILNAGDLMWLGPGLLNRFDFADTPTVLLHARFRLRCRTACADTEASALTDTDLTIGHRYLIVRGALEVVPIFERLIDEEHANLPHRSLRLRALLTLLCSWTLRQSAGGQSAGPGTFNLLQRRRLAALAADHHATRVSPVDLAAELRLTPDYFSRVFHRTYGLAPRTWLVRERIRAAAERLTDYTLTVGDVATEFGYDNLALFSRQFRAHMGQSPNAYRRQLPPRPAQSGKPKVD